jgi:hypothetical protein
MPPPGIAQYECRSGIDILLLAVVVAGAVEGAAADAMAADPQP